MTKKRTFLSRAAAFVTAMFMTLTSSGTISQAVNVSADEYVSAASEFDDLLANATDIEPFLFITTNEIKVNGTDIKNDMKVNGDQVNSISFKFNWSLSSLASYHNDDVFYVSLADKLHGVTLPEQVIETNDCTYIVKGDKLYIIMHAGDTESHQRGWCQLEGTLDLDEDEIDERGNTDVTIFENSHNLVVDGMASSLTETKSAGSVYETGGKYYADFTVTVKSTGDSRNVILTDTLADPTLYGSNVSVTVSGSNDRDGVYNFKVNRTTDEAFELELGNINDNQTVTVKYTMEILNMDHFLQYRSNGNTSPTSSNRNPYSNTAAVAGDNAPPVEKNAKPSFTLPSVTKGSGGDSITSDGYATWKVVVTLNGYANLESISEIDLEDELGEGTDLDRLNREMSNYAPVIQKLLRGETVKISELEALSSADKWNTDLYWLVNKTSKGYEIYYKVPVLEEYYNNNSYESKKVKNTITPSLPDFPDITISPANGSQDIPGIIGNISKTYTFNTTKKAYEYTVTVDIPDNLTGLKDITITDAMGLIDNNGQASTNGGINSISAQFKNGTNNVFINGAISGGQNGYGSYEYVIDAAAIRAARERGTAVTSLVITYSISFDGSLAGADYAIAEIKNNVKATYHFTNGESRTIQDDADIKRELSISKGENINISDPSQLSNFVRYYESLSLNNGNDPKYSSTADYKTTSPYYLLWEVSVTSSDWLGTNGNNGNFRIIDTIPDGLEIVDGSAVLHTDTYTGSNIMSVTMSQMGSRDWGVSVDIAQAKLKLGLNNTTNKTISLTYLTKPTDATAGSYYTSKETEFPYENAARFGAQNTFSEPVKHTQTITPKFDDTLRKVLNEGGAYVETVPSDNGAVVSKYYVPYTIEVNKGRQQLAPSGSKLTLTDTLGEKLSLSGAVSVKIVNEDETFTDVNADTVFTQSGRDLIFTLNDETYYIIEYTVLVNRIPDDWKDENTKQTADDVADWFRNDAVLTANGSTGTASRIAMDKSMYTYSGAFTYDDVLVSVIDIEGTKTWDKADGITELPIPESMQIVMEITETEQKYDESTKRYSNGGTATFNRIYTLTTDSTAKSDDDDDSILIVDTVANDDGTVTWKFRIENLPTQYTNSAGIITYKLQYAITEVTINGYVDNYTGNTGLTNTTINKEKDGTISRDENGRAIANHATKNPDITNTYNVRTDITVRKTWLDSVEPGTPRGTVYAVLLADGKRSDQPVAELNEENGWSYTWTDLPKYAVTYSSKKNVMGTTPIEYTIREITDSDGYYYDDVTGKKYESIPGGNDVDGFIITNSEITDITAEKKWNDGNTDHSTDSITVTLTAEPDVLTGKGITATAALSAENNWKAVWENLPVYNGKTKVVYNVTENGVDSSKYNSVVTKDVNDEYHFIITNTEKTSVDVEKSWQDPTMDKDDHEGVEIWLQKVTGTETDAEGNTVQTTENVEDANVENPITLDSSNGWKGGWNDLPKYDANENEIVYTVYETPVGGYDTAIEPTDSGFKITNTITAETSVSVTKIWKDNGNAYGTRPESIEVKLIAKVGEKDFDLTGYVKENPVRLTDLKLSHEWTKLPMYSDKGEVITYSVEEVGVAGGKLSVTDKNGDAAEYKYSCETVSGGFEITNTLSGKTEITVTKKWADGSQADMRPASITVQLYSDTGANGAEKLEDTQYISAAGNTDPNNGDQWSYKWPGLEKYDSDGRLINYTVKEVTDSDGNIDTADGKDGYYKSSGSGNKANGYTIINTLIAETDITVTKQWPDDEENKYGTRPESIEVILKADIITLDEDLAKRTLTKENGWETTWEGLQKYENGVKIVYTAEELSAPANYTAEQAEATEANGYTLKNRLNKNTEISITKIWNDDENAYSTRPGSIKVKLEYNKGGEWLEYETVDISADEDGNWSKTWTKLPDGVQYRADEVVPADRKLIVDEDSTYYYESSEAKSDGKGGFTVVNTLKDNTSITVTKQWPDDEENKYGTRPESIEVILKADSITLDEDVAKKTLTAENGWKAEWTALPKYEKGVKIIYTVEEIDVPGNYTAATAVADEDNGYTLVNKLNKTTEITINKHWDGDNYNEFGTRPASIEVQLYYYADGKWNEYGEPVEIIPDGNDWHYTWTKLPDGAVYMADEITYSGRLVYDINGVLNYEASESKEKSGGVFEVTNTLITNSITVNKTDIAQGKEVEGAKLELWYIDENGVEQFAEEWITGAGEDNSHEIGGLIPGRTYIIKETLSEDELHKIGIEYGIGSQIEFTVSVEEDGSVKVNIVSESVWSDSELEGDVMTDGSSVTVNDMLYKSVSISKMDVVHSAEISGAELEVYYIDENGNEVSVDKWITGEDGASHEVTGLETGKEYILRETITPDGYKTAGETRFTVDKTGKVTASGTDVTTDGGSGMIINDTLYGAVMIDKKDLSRDVEINGAVLTIYDKDGNVALDRFGEPLTWTSKSGEVWTISDLVPGEYILREDLNDLPYAVQSGISSDIVFTIDNDGNVSVISDNTSDYLFDSTKSLIVVHNELKTNSITINKMDLAKSVEIDGAVLAVFDRNGDLVDRWVSASNSTWTITDLVPGLEYTLKEESAPSFVANYMSQPIVFTITVDGEIVIISGSPSDYAVVNNQLIVHNKLGSDQPDQPVTGPDEPDAEIVLVKVFDGMDLAAMSSSERDAVLGKTLFQIRCSNGEDFAGARPVWDGSKAVVKFELINSKALKRGYTYSLTEIQAPDGYVRSATTYIYKIDDNGKVTYSEDGGKTFVSGVPTCVNLAAPTALRPDGVVTPGGEESVEAGAGMTGNAEGNGSVNMIVIISVLALLAAAFAARTAVRRRQR